MSNIEIELTRTLATASEDAYVDTSKGNLTLTPNFSVRKQIFDHETGFSVLILENRNTSEYIFSFRGTEGTSAQDWYTNLRLGTSQWNENNQDVARELEAIKGDGAS